MAFQRPPPRRFCRLCLEDHIARKWDFTEKLVTAISRGSLA